MLASAVISCGRSTDANFYRHTYLDSLIQIAISSYH